MTIGDVAAIAAVCSVPLLVWLLVYLEKHQDLRETIDSVLWRLVIYGILGALLIASPLPMLIILAVMVVIVVIDRYHESLHREIEQLSNSVCGAAWVVL